MKTSKSLFAWSLSAVMRNCLWHVTQTGNWCLASCGLWNFEFCTFNSSKVIKDVFFVKCAFHIQYYCGRNANWFRWKQVKNQNKKHETGCSQSRATNILVSMKTKSKAIYQIPRRQNSCSWYLSLFRFNLGGKLSNDMMMIDA